MTVSDDRSMTDQDAILRGLANLKQRAAAEESEAIRRRAAVLALRQSGSRPVRIIDFGRSPDCHVAIPDEYASPHHARAIQYDNGMVVIEDNYSTNGTFLNGHRVEGQELMLPGDVLRIGRTELPWKAPA
jgi:pSer/pThr/pTyr-binding forkhead associated (FHA) protein